MFQFHRPHAESGGLSASGREVRTLRRASGERADGVVVFAADERTPSLGSSFECRAARGLARRAPVVFVTGSGAHRPPLLRNLAQALFVHVDRDPCGAFVLHPAALPEGQRSSLALSGALLARRLETVLARLRIVTPAALICHPRGAHALEREAWSRIVYAPNERRLARPVPPEHFVRADRDLRAIADHEIEVAELPLASSRATARTRPTERVAQRLASLPRPFYAVCSELDAPELDVDLLVRLADRLTTGTLLVPYAHGALVERLDEAERVTTIEAGVDELRALADVVLAPLDPDVDVAPPEPFGLFEALAAGTPVVATRAPVCATLGDLVRTVGDVGGALCALRAAAQERDDALRTRRRRAADDLRWRELEERLAEALGLPDPAEAVRSGRMPGWTAASS